MCEFSFVQQISYLQHALGEPDECAIYYVYISRQLSDGSRI